MRILTITLFLALFLFSCGKKTEAQTIPEQIQETLEAPDTVENVVLYVVRYYLDSNDLIEDVKPVRDDMEWYVFTRMPEKFPDRNIEYLEHACDGPGDYITYLNSGGEEYPVCFSIAIREPNNPPINITDKRAVDVSYKFRVRLTW